MLQVWRIIVDVLYHNGHWWLYLYMNMTDYKIVKMEETCLETYCTLISEEIIHSLRATTSQKRINVST